MKKENVLWIWILPAVFLVFSSCGYRFSGSRDMAFAKNPIIIEVFENRTMENGAGFLAANRFIEVFSRRGAAAGGEKDAGAADVLSGVVESMSISTISEKSRHQPSERRLTLVLSLTWVGKDGKILWRGKKISGDRDYRVGAGKLETEQNRRRAVSDLAGILGERAFYMMARESGRRAP
ncbi:conserved hypothetical protein [Candidatus Desulfarcum epimagneticum]|uniref:Lipoprotein n=1 Tax=uncultured Desulfobacteraceae bacterium TaxID=218296 RepID=A0A484HLV6_9BACT|nr:conserved hypothetical protein [uncultured Desulfobacteraceae bacterium]